MHLDHDEAMRGAMAADHGVLATLHASRGADLVPACFAITGEWLAVPIDSVKPKGSTALGRIRNLERDPRATLLVEHWDAADWSRLWWVKLSLVRRDATPRAARRPRREPAVSRATISSSLYASMPSRGTVPWRTLVARSIREIVLLPERPAPRSRSGSVARIASAVTTPPTAATNLP